MSERNAIKCIECASLGNKESKVSFYTTRTRAHVRAYYDETGKYHIHDPNTTIYHYVCSHKHSWTASTTHKNHCCSDDSIKTVQAPDTGFKLNTKLPIDNIVSTYTASTGDTEIKSKESRESTLPPSPPPDINVSGGSIESAADQRAQRSKAIDDAIIKVKITAQALTEALLADTVARSELLLAIDAAIND